MSASKETGIGTDPEDVKKLQLDRGDKIALKHLLEKRLIECGWRKDIEQKIRDTLEERGLGNVTHEQLSAEIIPQVTKFLCKQSHFYTFAEKYLVLLMGQHTVC